MPSKQRSHRSNPKIKSSGVEWPEKMKLSQAVKFLGVSFHKITTLVASGKLAFERDDLDNRVKLVKRADLEKMLRRRTRE